MNRAEAVREFVAATSGEVVSKLFVNGLVEQIDFRSDYRALRHEETELPAPVETGLRALMTELDLVFGCVDFVLDQTGEHHFLEVNPTGHFGWLEGTVGVPNHRRVG